MGNFQFTMGFPFELLLGRFYLIGFCPLPFTIVSSTETLANLKIPNKFGHEWPYFRDLVSFWLIRFGSHGVFIALFTRWRFPQSCHHLLFVNTLANVGTPNSHLELKEWFIAGSLCIPTANKIPIKDPHFFKIHVPVPCGDALLLSISVGFKNLIIPQFGNK